MSEKDDRKSVKELKEEFAEKLQNQRDQLVKMFGRYHSLGVSLEKLMVETDRMIAQYEKEINDGTGS